MTPGKMNRSIREAGGGSWLYRSSRFSAIAAEAADRHSTRQRLPEIARTLYERFVSEVQALAIPLSTGVFQAMMDVELTQSGTRDFHPRQPQTILNRIHGHFEQRLSAERRKCGRKHVTDDGCGQQIV
jgi:hypothetical protein